MASTVISAKERQWQDWSLGRGKYKPYGPRNYKHRPDIGIGAPGEEPIPRDWWGRLEAILVPNDKEPIIVPGRVDRVKARLPRRPIDPRQLTPHFHAREFNCKNGAIVPQKALPALDRLCTYFLEAMRAEFGVCHVLSGYRPRQYNASIGGAKFSQHIYELTPDSVAADTFYDHGNPISWAKYARELANKVRKGGVGQYNQSHFVHIDNGPRRDWWG